MRDDLVLTKEKIMTIVRENSPYLTAEYSVKRIGLFGSYANGTATDISDIDLVVEFDQPLGLKFMELCDYLEQMLGKEVDVLTPSSIEHIRLPHVAQRIRESAVYVER